MVLKIVVFFCAVAGMLQSFHDRPEPEVFRPKLVAPLA